MEPEQVIALMSSQIYKLLRGVAHEQYAPIRSSDDMDDYIKSGKEKAKALRKLREDYENLMTGVL